MDTEEDEIDECSLAISKEFKFSLLCEYLQCIKNVPKQAKTSRRRIFTSLLEKWSSYNRSQSQTTESTSNYTASFYPALRLIINAYDNRKFNMKSKKLIAKVCKVLLIPDETKKELLKIDSTVILQNFCFISQLFT
ncbi:unnamed protein product [Anisakis simplex]|uniref:DNA_ligase_A_N domain-containing protein n=1 Tax=Anisakis simplex TaxID=6269 RepID=A0A0M3J8M0_ANISI|nr:unnamed protein product [Anisakis simplex]